MGRGKGECIFVLLHFTTVGFYDCLIRIYRVDMIFERHMFYSTIITTDHATRKCKLKINDGTHLLSSHVLHARSSRNKGNEPELILVLMNGHLTLSIPKV